jgi:hypothetical protein
MTVNEHDVEALNRCCLGNQEAMEFLMLWRDYVHDIDDIIDCDKDNEKILATFAHAAIIYSHPFYLRNILALRQLVLNCTNAYADSVMWEQSTTEWHRTFSDVYRHFGSEMVLAVATICAGPNAYTHLRAISPELRNICYLEHHSPNGTPV